MKHPLRWLLLLPLILATAFAGLYWAVGAWLESAGGREAVEHALSDRLGLPVHLLGEFKVMLWPDIGVSGTRLVIGEPGDASEVARGGDFEVAVALRPLIRGELQVDSFSLGGGAIYPDRLDRTNQNEPQSVPVQSGLRLPAIDAFSIRNFEIELASGSSGPLRVEAFEFHDFLPGKTTPFTLSVEGFGRLSGSFEWLPDVEQVRVAGAWSGMLPEAVEVDLEAGLASGAGALDARYRPGATAEALGLKLAWRERPPGWSLSGIELSAGGQLLSGSGCLYTTPDTVVHLELSAATLDVPSLLNALPELPKAGGGGGGGMPLDARVRLRASEIRVEGGRASNTELVWGGQPDCAGLAEAQPGQAEPGGTP